MHLRRYEKNQCRECGIIVQESSEMLSWNQVLPWGTHMNQDPTTNCLKYCFYCMDTVTCMNCMADENVFIPRELHLDKPP